MTAAAHDAEARRHEAEAAKVARTDPEQAAAEQANADAHRRASDALTRDETVACAGVPPESFDQCALPPDARIVETGELRSPLDGKAEYPSRLVGATITVVETATRTKDELERRVACNLARVAERGEQINAADCPLSVPGSKATVAKTASGLRVEIRGDNAEHVKEIVRRADVLGGK